MPSPLQEEQTQAVQDILTDLSSMFNNAEFSDVAFLCQDGGRVPACRLFLAARSSVLKSMLTNGMAESRMSEISLPEVSSHVLSSVLEFLYTGAIASLSWRRALEVIMAARYLLLETLEANAWAFLAAAASEAGDAAAEESADRLSAALEFPALWDASRSGILLEVVHILETKLSEPDSTHKFRALSEEAFRFFLDKTRPNDGTGMFSFANYLRVRQVILWCASQLVPPPDVCVAAFLPVAKSLCALVQAPGPEGIEAAPTTIKPLGDDVTEKLARSVQPWLPMVDFLRLHPSLLVKVVEPISILPSSLLLEVFRFQAVRRTRDLSDQVCGWDAAAHGEGYTTSGKSCLKIGYGYGVARGSMAMSRPGLYEWDVVVDEVNDNFCDIGIISACPGVPIDYDSYYLSCHPCGRALAICDAGTFITKEQKIIDKDLRWGRDEAIYVPYGKPYCHQDARVRVHLDLFERSCSFSVDGDKFGVAWDCLPDGIYYPAVSLGRPQDRVHIELVSGSEFL